MRLLSIIFFSLLSQIGITQNSEVPELVYDYIEQHIEEWGLSQSDVDELIVTDFYQSKKSQVQNIYLRQSIDQIEIFNSNANAHVKNGIIIRFNQNFLSGINNNFNQKNPAITAERAIRNTAVHLGQEQTFDLQVKETKNQNNKEKIFFAGDYAYEDINSKLSFYPIKKQLILCWEIAINDVVSNKWWQVFVDAVSGEIIAKVSWTTECNFGLHEESTDVSSCNTKSPEHIHITKSAKRNSAESLMTNTYNVFPIPFMSPLDGGLSLESAPWNDALNASPFGWHDTNGAAGNEFTTTRGNNVHAQEDRNGNNGTGTQTDGGAGLDFDFTFDEHAVPSTYTDFAVTNLFYWNNIAHDVWYQYGFDEVSGNFQFNNYGNGGSGSDEVRADAQDGSGFNNANFSTPPDGGNPRMQMFEWSAKSFNTLTLNTPSAIARNYGVAGASFGPQDDVVTGNVVEADPILGCSALTNGGAISGNIAIINKGSCGFPTKVKNAQNAGAIAVIICNNNNNPPSNLTGTDPTITIPSVMLSKMNCDTIKDYLPGVNITIDVNSPVIKDSDLENGVILHEYGHGISIRLTGGPNTSSCLGNQEQMGEGWSDWFGVVTTMQDLDIGLGTRGMGPYLTGEPLNDEGIRTYPYTTDMSINQHTYDDIKNASVPHGLGTVWCEMLWEMTWGLIEEHGFDIDLYNGTGGNNMAMELVIEGLKLQPCNPGFVDGRDAILLADQNLNAGVNQCIIWEAFAKRGLGFSASQGSSGSRSDGTEAFDMPPLCDAEFKISKVAHQIVESGTDLSYNFVLINDDLIDHTNIVLLDTLPANTTLVPASITCNGSINGNVVTLTKPSMPQGTTEECYFLVETTQVDNSSLDFFDGVESGTANWTVSSGQGSGVFTESTANPHIGTKSWFIPNLPADNSQYLTSISLTLGNIPVLAFSHDYDTEVGWDGGMVEISIDGGSNWTDLGDQMFFNGYNGTLGNSSNSDIFGRSAFTGDSNGYLTSYVNLESYANQNALIRFFFGSDDNTVQHGWYIDQIILYEGSFIVNNVCLTSNEGANACDDVSTFVRKECDVPFIVYEDNDNDGFGNPSSTLLVCSLPNGYVADNTDCDDNDANNYPGNTEICGDGIDNNCNNMIDEGCMVFTCDGDSLFINSISQNEYHAEDYINSDAVIASGQTIQFTAGIDIDLISGFEVESGTDFHAFIQTCNILMREVGEINAYALLENDENWKKLMQFMVGKEIEISIYNTKEQLVQSIQINEAEQSSEEKIKSALNKLDGGLYILKASDENDKLVLRYLTF